MFEMLFSLACDDSVRISLHLDSVRSVSLSAVSCETERNGVNFEIYAVELQNNSKTGRTLQRVPPASLTSSDSYDVMALQLNVHHFTYINWLRAARTFLMCAQTCCTDVRDKCDGRCQLHC